MTASHLIDYSNVPGAMVSGMSDDEYSWVAQQSVERYVRELDDGFLKQFEFPDELLEDGVSELPHVEETIVKAMNEAESDLMPESTSKQTKYHVERFKRFLSEKKLDCNIQKLPTKILAEYLRFFYFSLRTKSGEPYSPNSLIGIRASIQRYLQNPQVNRPENIISDKEFMRANATLKVMVKLWLKSGKSSAKFPPIEDADMNILKSYFDRSNAEVLQQEVWFNIVYYFALRGRETVAQLTKDSIEFSEDSDGRKFAYINHNVLSKNIKSTLKNNEFENLKVARMYDNPDNIESCPLAALQLYFSKLPNNNYLFPQVVKDKNAKSWYCEKRSLGKNNLGQMMQTISKKAKLTQMYTNHCIRVRVVSELHHKGFSSEDICSVTGHRSTGSVRHYVRVQRDQQKRKLSEALQMNQNEPKSIKGTSEVEITHDQLINENKIFINKPKQIPLVLNFNGEFNNCSFSLCSE